MRKSIDPMEDSAKLGTATVVVAPQRSSAAMSFQSAIPWQGALQQSLPPLHRLETILNNQCCRTMIFQRTATTPLIPCLSPRVHFNMPLPPPLSGTNDTDFASDPGVAFDTLGNVFSSYIVVFFGNGSGVNGTELAVARSTNNGQTFPLATFFSFATGGDHFNDKPLMA